ncbi:DUF7455 domain-containing protein [Streptomyces griseus]|uniref:DUF7455 domain-containing protein n=1 Tax=Streptomyces griseus TaxID=1911 RepID=UPI003404B140
MTVLTALDRCDRCPAAAAYRASLLVDSPPYDVPTPTLDLCGHHWRKNGPAMTEQGWVVIAGNPEVFATELEGTPS